MSEDTKPMWVCEGERNVAGLTFEALATSAESLHIQGRLITAYDDGAWWRLVVTKTEDCHLIYRMEGMGGHFQLISRAAADASVKDLQRLAYTIWRLEQ